MKNQNFTQPEPAKKYAVDLADHGQTNLGKVSENNDIQKQAEAVHRQRLEEIQRQKNQKKG